MADEFAPLSSMVYAGSPLRGSLMQADMQIKNLSAAGKTQEAAQYHQAVMDQVSAIAASNSQSEIGNLSQGLKSTLSVLDGYARGMGEVVQKKTAADQSELAEKKNLGNQISAMIDLANLEQVQLDPNKLQLAVDYMKEGNVVGAKVIQADLAQSIEKAKAMRDSLRVELEGQQKAMEASDDLSAKISAFITDEGDPSSVLDIATGFGEEAQTFFGKVTGGIVGNSPATISNQQKLNRIVEKDLLEASKYLKPVSDDEMKMLKSNRPQITDPPEVWADYLSDIRNILDRDKARWEASLKGLQSPNQQSSGVVGDTAPPSGESRVDQMNKFFRNLPQQQ